MLVVRIRCRAKVSRRSAKNASGVSSTDFAADESSIFPPWQHERNNDSANLGFEFTVPQVDVLADFHGDPINAELVLYVGGNYFFACLSG